MFGATKRIFNVSNLLQSSECKESETPLDMQELLNKLVSSTNMDLQVKILTIFEAHIITKKTDITMIATCDRVYEIINRILLRGLPFKTTSTLNFICALIYFHDSNTAPSQPRCLPVYARNKIRTTGCLTTMCQMFTDSMMYLDTWKALCRCLSEVCHNSEVNQNFCSYLIPKCIEKCKAENIEILRVLKSLLHNNHDNTQTFIDNRGLSIFNREVLQYSTSMQLLQNIIHIFKEAIILIHQTVVIQYLNEFLQIYGQKSQIGYWSYIILNSINQQITEYANEKITVGEPELGLTKDRNNATYTVNRMDEDNTTVLFQNVAKEVYLWNTQHHSRKIRKETELNESLTPITILSKGSTKIDANSKELSFSFLMSGNSYLHEPNILTDNREVKYQNLKRAVTRNPSKLDTNIINQFSNMTKLNRNDNCLKASFEFQPAFFSTPKTSREKNRKKIMPKLRKRYRKLKHRETQCDEAHVVVQDRNNKSMSARFFNAINDSCSTVVQKITNIFKSNKSQSTTNALKHAPTGRDCSYSFTTYMKRRDAMMDSKHVSNSSWESDQISLDNKVKQCKTCNDTKILKLKLNNNRHLRQTLKKLKMGINFYGCDFKKISRTMWPRDTFMTPIILHKLYRKLLARRN